MPCEVPQDVYSGVAQQVGKAGLFVWFSTSYFYPSNYKNLLWHNMKLLLRGMLQFVSGNYSYDSLSPVVRYNRIVEDI